MSRKSGVLELAVLGLLHDAPMHGYELRKRLNALLGPLRAISYGSLYNYDVRVPLCFYGPQFEAGVFEAPVESVDVAPTLARAMGVAVPSSCTGRVLGEAFAE